MRVRCPYCDPKVRCPSELPRIIRFGHFYRKSDSRKIQRFRCLSCLKGFSRATGHPCYLQNKRHVNALISKLLSSGVSQRRIARLLNIHRITVVRKMLFLAKRAGPRFEFENRRWSKAKVVEFDDMETFEHTKCKPISITIAVESESRRILGFEVSQMPAKGRLARISVKKYGLRRDDRQKARENLFKKIQSLVDKKALIKSDSNPHYLKDVSRFFPECEHQTFLGQRGSVTGQGELKKIRFDPLFSLNHTCAKLRADVNRLFRKTWCTTKKIDRLKDHLAIYAQYHNQHLSV